MSLAGKTPNGFWKGQSDLILLNDAGEPFCHCKVITAHKDGTATILRQEISTPDYGHFEGCLPGDYIGGKVRVTSDQVVWGHAGVE